MRISNAHYLIVDLEATCSEDETVPRDEMEIIEIGALMQNAHDFEVVSEFQTFVRPVRNPRLTPFCTKLTSITQADVDAAPEFRTALETFGTWMAGFDDALFCSWGNYDRTQFQRDCRFHDLAYPFHTEHLNLSAEFSRSLNLRKKFGIGRALRRLRLTFEGTPHRGIDDVRNIARIVRRVCERNQP